MSVTCHHYGATVLDAPIHQLRRDMYTILNVPEAIVRTPRRATSVAAIVVAEQSQPCVQLAIEPDDTTILEEVIDRVSGTHALTYRWTMCAPEIAEYAATCTLQRMADAPNTTFVEWTRAYRLAAPADRDQVRRFVRALVDQDRAIASHLAAEYGSTEVLYIDYTLGGI
ncbi:MAG TPA: hypothetical protein VFO07_00565 [Roseiflexaceae bacterium]|nr:hypothetical protein [Roseiflexaceae bacterium]